MQGTVFEAGGRGVTARGEVTVDPYPFYLGVRRPAEAIARPGSPLTFRVAAGDKVVTSLERVGVKAGAHYVVEEKAGSTTAAK